LRRTTRGSVPLSLVCLKPDLDLKATLTLNQRSHLFTVKRMPRTNHSRHTQGAFRNVGPGAAGGIEFEPGRGRLAADREMLCGHYLDLKMIRNVSPVRYRKHA